MDEPDLPLWLADMARQAVQISRDTRSAVEMVISLEPDVRQPDAAAAEMARSSASASVDLAQRQITGMTALLDAVRTLANSDLGGQLRIETRETVAKLLLHLNVKGLGRPPRTCSRTLAPRQSSLRHPASFAPPEPGSSRLASCSWSH